MYYATEDSVTTADKSNDPAWIQITERQYHEALVGMQGGKMVTTASGFAVIDKSEPEPEQESEIETTPPTAEELAAGARAQRDGLLLASDWVVVRSKELGQHTPDDWAAYRQALRDIPEQSGFPENVEWPEPPKSSTSATQ